MSEGAQLNFSPASTPDRLRLIIARHGETEANVGRVLQGHLDNPLSERGNEQVTHLGKRLLEEGVEIIYSSDLKRAQATANAFAELAKLPVKIEPRLRERSYGEFEGQPVTEYETALMAANVSREAYAPRGGESLLDVEKRVSSFLESLIAQNLGKTVLIVAHAGTNRMLLKILLKKEFSAWLTLQQDNACVNILEIGPDEHVREVILNCVSHLGSMGHLQMPVYE